MRHDGAGSIVCDHARLDMARSGFGWSIRWVRQPLRCCFEQTDGRSKNSLSIRANCRFLAIVIKTKGSAGSQTSLRASMIGHSAR